MKRISLSGAKLRNASRLLALLVAVCWVHNLYAVEVDGIYYSLNQTEQTASVVRNTPTNSYSGIVNIPEEIVYDGVTYDVTSIGSYAFLYCSDLVSVTIGNKITSIGEYAFSNCSLSKIVIPNSVISIDLFAFDNCSSLTDVTIGNSVTSISYRTFQHCENIEKIVVVEGNPYYDSREDCNAVISTREDGSGMLIVGCKNTRIPNSVTYIEQRAFMECKGLVEIDIPSSVKGFGRAAFSDCTNLKRVEIPNSVTSIGMDIFSNCRSLTEVIIPNSVTSIGSEAFKGCSLTELVIPNSVTSIGSEAFRSCRELRKLTIGNGVTFIGGYAFTGCSSITSVISQNPVPPVITAYTFDETTEQNATLHVPTGCKGVYQQADYWNNFYNILDNAPLTSIEEISVDMQSDNEIYTVNGVKLNITNISELPKGIYIINGKKVAMK